MRLASIFRNLCNAVLTMTVAATLAGWANPARAQMYANGQERIQFSFDVAEDMGLFVEPRVPMNAEPLRGSFFITEGKIFPAGTIPRANGAQFDPNAITGQVGRWFCKGTFLVKGSEFDKSSTAVLTDQLFLFPDSERSIATTGTEGAGMSVRPVIGGTGPYAGYTGEQRQEFLGFNKTGGVNLRVTITLRKTTNYR